ncbi:hypothetical protein ACTI_65940 [Actinoplanes sp. OR16]|nr:hypothetical protein ACTI_65940 [Actinoplanes sp. OR16]
MSRCDVTGAVTDSDFDTLLAQPNRVSSPIRRLRCELRAGHPGRHAAFVLAAAHGDRWWWMRWNTAGGEVADIPVCAVSDEDNDDCLLPQHHEGEHSFQLSAGDH